MKHSTTDRDTRIKIHETAIIDASAQLGDGVEIGPYAIVGPNVKIGANTRIGPRVLIEKNTTIGIDCSVANGAVLGTDPQDLKYDGEETFLQVGDRTAIREFATLNRTTRPPDRIPPWVATDAGPSTGLSWRSASRRRM